MASATKTTVLKTAIKRTWCVGSIRKGCMTWATMCMPISQPDGGWGWSNAGLIAHDTGALLVDTLFALSHTREMLDTMRARVPGAQRIETLINTHATFAIRPGA